MVKIVDGENVFEVLPLREVRGGDWFLDGEGNQVLHLAGDTAIGVRHILRPISGPAARPERRVDAEMRHKFSELYLEAWMRDALREAYRRGQRMPYRKGAE